MYLTDHHHTGLALVKLTSEWDESDRPAATNPFRKCCFQIVKDCSDRHELSMRCGPRVASDLHKKACIQMTLS
jgi:hypothetical protein